jgi:hypothetical protein
VRFKNSRAIIYQKMHFFFSEDDILSDDDAPPNEFSSNLNENSLSTYYEQISELRVIYCYLSFIFLFRNIDNNETNFPRSKEMLLNKNNK